MKISQNHLEFILRSIHKNKTPSGSLLCSKTPLPDLEDGQVLDGLDDHVLLVAKLGIIYLGLEFHCRSILDPCKKYKVANS